MIEVEALPEEARKVFGEVFHGDVNWKHAVVAPKDDLGGWAPRSLLVIYKEYGIPDRYYFPASHKLWDEVEERLSKSLGKPVFFEDVNSAVAALYWA
jgi:hypothetical protein